MYCVTIKFVVRVSFVWHIWSPKKYLHKQKSVVSDTIITSKDFVYIISSILYGKARGREILQCINISTSCRWCVLQGKISFNWTCTFQRIDNNFQCSLSFSGFLFLRFLNQQVASNNRVSLGPICKWVTSNILLLRLWLNPKSKNKKEKILTNLVQIYIHISSTFKSSKLLSDSIEC